MKKNKHNKSRTGKMMKFLIGIFIVLLSINSYSQAPTISSFTPLSGTVGTLVTINGTNLSNPSAFSIAGISAVSVSNNGTSLVGMVMPGATTGPVSITTAGGTATSGSNFTVSANILPSTQEGSKIIGGGQVGTAQFGHSVAVSADGNTAAVGGWLDNGNSGAVWIYVRSGGVWTQQGSKLFGTGGSTGIRQGNQVAISADGNTVMWSEYQDVAQAVYVWTRTGSTWTQQARIVSLGAGFGVSLALSADGNTAAIGGFYFNGNAGREWIFTRSAGSWTLQATLDPFSYTAGGGFGGPLFGYSSALSANGNTLAVGAAADGNGSVFPGAMYIFTRSGATWTAQQKLLPSSLFPGSMFGCSAAISADGNTVAGGAIQDNNPAGRVHVFTRSGATWTQQASLLGTGFTNAQQGMGVSLSADGNILAEGGPAAAGNAGATWLWSRAGATWTQQSVVQGTGAATARQGSSVSISADGKTIMEAGYQDNGNNGAAWVFIPTPPPTVSSFSPSSACTGTTSVIITGSNFTGATGVTLNGVAALSFSVNSATQITASFNVINSGVISVTAPSGSGASTAMFIANSHPTASISASGSTTFCSGSSVVLSGPSDNAINFNGTNYITAPHISAIMPTTAMTIETWVKPTTTSIVQYLVSKGTLDVANGQYGIVLVGNQIYFHIFQGGHFQVISPAGAVTAGVWSHIAGTWDDTTMKLYVNGVFQGSTALAGPIANNTDVLQIGWLGYVGVAPYNSQANMDELRIWNVARTQGQILDGMNSSVAANSTGLVAYYKFNEASGTTTADATANANTATLISSPSHVIPSNAPSSNYSYSWSPAGTTASSITATTTANNIFTLSDISTGCSSTASQSVTALANYNITATAGANGTISPNGTTAVCSGTNQAYTITPNGGYHILDVLVDGVSNAGAIGSGTFTFTNVTATHTISVTFAPNCTIPVITPPSNITVSNSAGVCGAIVNYTATITGSPTPTVTYSQNSGTTFSIGTTTVTITASNTCGTVTSIFTVTVYDTEVPVINTHANITQSNDAGMCSAVVTFTAPTASDNCSVSSVVCTPASGSTFAAGTTTVNCVATDSHGNTASTSFTVTVNDTEAPVISGNSATANSNDDAAGNCAFTSGSVGANVGSYTITGDNCSSSFTVQENFFFNGNPDGTATWTLGAGTWFPVHTYQVGVTTVNVTVTDAAGNSSTTSYTQTVVDNELPTITAPSDVTVCNGASITLGTPTTGDNCGVATVINNAPGSYSVGTTVVTWTVTDIHGNTATATQNVIVNALPSATISASNGLALTCANPNTVLSVPTPGGTTQLWNQNGTFFATASNPLVTVGATYDVTVTVTATGCTTNSSVTTTLNNTAPDATITASNGLTFCDGNSTVLSVPVTGTTSQAWNQNGVFFATASNPLVTVGATYDVTVTDATNGCTASSSVTTVANPLPIGSASNIVICNGDPSNVPLNSTEANTTYTWTSSVTTGGVIGNNDCVSGCGNAIADVLTNTGYVHGVVTYTVIPTSGLGCTGAPFTANVTVGAAPAAPVISGPNALCGLTSTIYTITAVPEATSYVWTVPTGVTGMTITGGQGTTTLHVSISAGTVSGDVTCTAYNNCGSSTTTTFAVTKKPAVPGAITGPTSTCGQTTATYSVAPVFGATSYIWTLPSGMTGTSSTNTITVTIAGTFVYGQLKVSAVNACGNVPGTGIWITGNAPTTPLTLSGPANVCGLTTGTYSIPAVAGASGYNWTITGAGNSISGSNTGTTATAILAGPGTISVAATNLCGSSPYRALTLVTTAVQPGAISGPANTCGLTTASYSVAPVANAATYTWGLATGMTWGTGQGTNVITVNIAPSVGSTTAVSPLKVSETNTCGNVSLFRTTSITRCLSPDAMNAEGGNTFSNVYPNPTSSEFTMDVTVDKDQDIILEVFDILGNIVISEKHMLATGTSTMKTNMEQFNNGMYFVRILDANSNVMHTERVVKQ